jgi:error-prone DNA polymerase
LAITDVASLAGVVRAHAAAKQHGLHLVIGAEIEPAMRRRWCSGFTDRAAYGRLCRLITLGRRRAAERPMPSGWQDVAEHAEGMLAGVLIRDPDRQHEGQALRGYRECFGPRGYLLAELHRGPDDAHRLEHLQRLPGRAACRWSPPATCTTTRRLASRCSTC